MSLFGGGALVGRLGGKPPGTPYLDALPLTLNCRPGDVTVSGVTAGDDVMWVSRASAGPSGTNSLFRHGNTGGGDPTKVNSVGVLNGKSTLIIPGNTSVETRLTGFDAVPTVERQAHRVLNPGADFATTFTIFMLVRFASNAEPAGANEIMGVGDFSNGRGSMATNVTNLHNEVWLGSESVDVAMRAAPGWQVLWMTLSPATLDASVNRDAATSVATVNRLFGGLATIPFIVGPFNSRGHQMELGGVWGTNTALTFDDRKAIIDELRVFTGEALP